MTDILTNPLTTDEQQSEQARRAVKVFRQMQPTLSAYARALTRDKNARIDLAIGTPRTDGKVIYIQPPMALGDVVEHSRNLCDKRDESLQLRCKACRQREEVLVVVYHEIAHICYESFAPVRESDKIAITMRATEEGGEAYAREVQRRYDAAPWLVRNSYKGVASLISEFLPIIFNALEDARVNGEMFKARMGTRIMFQASVHQIFDEGVEQTMEDGSIQKILWKDYPLNLQVIVGTFIHLCDYEHSGWFAEKVEEDLKDKDLQNILSKMDTVRSAGDIYNLSFLVLKRLRELGYCLSDLDPESEESEESDASETGDSDESGEADEGVSGSPGGESEPEEAAEGPGGNPEGELADEESEPDEGTESDKNSDEEAVDDEDGFGSGSDDPEGEPSLVPDGESAPDGVDPGGEDEFDRSDSDDRSGDHSEDTGEPDAVTSDDDVEEELGGQPGESSEHDGSGSRADGEGNPDDSELVDNGDDKSDARGEHHGGSSPESTPNPTDDNSSDGTGEVGDSGVQSPDRSGSDSTDLDGEAEESDAQAIDTGADEGLGGVQVLGEKEFGTAEKVSPEVHRWLGHPGDSYWQEDSDVEKDLEIAIVQGVYFETPSVNIFGVRVHKYGDPDHPINSLCNAWRRNSIYSRSLSRTEIGISGDFDPPESILGPALMRMRVAFADNKRGKDQGNLKSGRVNSRVLGKRVHSEDERLFKRRVIPGKKDYFVLIGVDVSASTAGVNLVLEKRAALAQATLCSRMGIPFAVYAHSGNSHSTNYKEGDDLDIYVVKAPEENWTEKIADRLRELGPDAENLDGHTLEFYRKVCDAQPQTDKIIMYYTDGKMPAENHDEELEILRREIKICKQKKYTLLGVGIRTDSPIRHGLDTVQVNDDADVIKVVRHLEKRLLGG